MSLLSQRDFSKLTPKKIVKTLEDEKFIIRISWWENLGGKKDVNSDQSSNLRFSWNQSKQRSKSQKESINIFAIRSKKPEDSVLFVE